MTSVKHGDSQHVQSTVQSIQLAKFPGHRERQKNETIRKTPAMEKSSGVPTPQGKRVTCM